MPCPPDRPSVGDDRCPGRGKANDRGCLRSWAILRSGLTQHFWAAAFIPRGTPAVARKRAMMGPSRSARRSPRGRSAPHGAAAEREAKVIGPTSLGFGTITADPSMMATMMGGASRPGGVQSCPLRAEFRGYPRNSCPVAGQPGAGSRLPVARGSPFSAPSTWPFTSRWRRVHTRASGREETSRVLRSITPTRARRPFDASVDPTEARKQARSRDKPSRQAKV
jgi:hypothetical protein